MMIAFLKFIKKIFSFLLRRNDAVDAKFNPEKQTQELINKPIINEENTILESKENIAEVEPQVKTRVKKKQKRDKIIPEFTFTRVEDVPDELKKGIVYIVGDKGYEWLIAMTCPCGCKEQILLNTLKETKPCWRFVCYKSGIVTVNPSVNRIRNCRSHFTITKGILKWWDEYNYPSDN